MSATKHDFLKGRKLSFLNNNNKPSGNLHTIQQPSNFSNNKFGGKILYSWEPKLS
jgi:hypothetical protein